MSTNDTVRTEVVLNAVVDFIASMRAQGGLNIYKAYYKRRDTSLTGGIKLTLPAEDRFTELETRLAHGMLEALVCHEQDVRDYGVLGEDDMPIESKLVSVGTAADMTKIVRQRIQDLCKKGFLPHLVDPYHGHYLIVRRAVKDLAKEGNPNLRKATG